MATIARCRLVTTPDGDCRAIIDCCPFCSRSHLHYADADDLGHGYRPPCSPHAVYQLEPLTEAPQDSGDAP